VSGDEILNTLLVKGKGGPRKRRTRPRERVAEKIFCGEQTDEGKKINNLRR